MAEDEASKIGKTQNVNLSESPVKNQTQSYKWQEATGVCFCVTVIVIIVCFFYQDG